MIERRRAQMKKPETQKETLTQLWFAIIGNGAVGLLGRMDSVESKIDEHAKWHLAQRMAILLAGVGWLVALALGAWAIFGSGK
jgi:hypothetical protein